MLGIIEQLPAARFIVMTPVLLPTEHAVDAPAVKLCNPSEFEDGTVVTVKVS
jgi:hypothetical protein